MRRPEDQANGAELKGVQSMREQIQYPRNGALAPDPEPKVERPKPREGSDMAEMLANIDKQNTTFEHTKTHVNSNGAIALLEEPFMPQAPLVKTEKKCRRRSVHRRSSD